MICRIWHGWTTPGNAAAYEHLLNSEILAGIEARGVAGLRGVHLLRRDAPDAVEFITLIWFDSVDAIRRFAGEDHERAVVPPRARELLLRYEERATHYEVRREGGAPPPDGATRSTPSVD